MAQDSTNDLAKRVEDWSTWAAGVQRQLKRARLEGEHIDDVLPRVLAHRDRLADALLFYADEKNWTERDDGTVECECDIGEVAREALKDAEFANASAPKECERCEGLNEVACQRGYEIDRLATALWKLHAASKNTGRRVGVEWDMVRKIISAALAPREEPDHTSDTK